MKQKIGIGYDVHRLAEGRKLILTSQNETNVHNFDCDKKNLVIKTDDDVTFCFIRKN